MTDLEKAARMALEALESMKTYAESTEPGLIVGVPAIDALRRALEQPAQQEPVGALILGGIVDTSSGPEYEDWDVEWNNKAVEALQERLVTGEPVTLPLYTRPQSMTPLTDEQIKDVAAFCRWWVREKDILDDAIEFARAIEAAHGIGEKK